MTPTIAPSQLPERELISQLSSAFLRSPHQRNATFESDAELISLGLITLAVTTDTIAEEIDAGLYRDPFLVGWMTVMVNASDLAAVGAEAIGLVISESLPKDIDAEFLRQLQAGINAASREIGLPILGGDTNIGRSLSMCGTAIGCIRDARLIRRTGAEPGDILFTSGRLGAGNAFAAYAMGLVPHEVRFMPIARLREGPLVRQFGSCAMDTSDGAIATLFQLSELNGVGFSITTPLANYLDYSALALQDTAIEPWMTLAAPHGEFELLFTIPTYALDQFTTNAHYLGWSPIRLGHVTEETDCRLTIFDKLVTLDPAQFCNFAIGSQADVQAMLGRFRTLDQNWKKEGVLC